MNIVRLKWLPKLLIVSIINGMPTRTHFKEESKKAAVRAYTAEGGESIQLVLRQPK